MYIKKETEGLEEDHSLLIQAMWMNNNTDQKNKIVKGKKYEIKKSFK